MSSGISATLAPGSVLSGRYRIESVLGQGGMGSVYLARLDTLANKLLAIKEMRLGGGGDTKAHQQAVEQFQQEARFLANLDHPNLVAVTDFFEENGRNYLVMAYVKGQTLAQLLQERRGAFPLAKVLEWAEQLTNVLHYLHSQNPPILFRDLKPSNIMLDEAGRIRLIDFGIARSFQSEEQTATFLQGMGSAGYSPLEQYRGAGGTDQRSDIYALGASLYHLLTNRVPPSPVELVTDNKEIPSPRQYNPTLPVALEQVLLKMMALRKDARYSSMQEVAAALRAVGRNLQNDDDGTEDLGAPALAAAAAASVPTREPVSPPTAPVGTRGVVAIGSGQMGYAGAEPASDRLLMWGFLGLLTTGLMGMFGFMVFKADDKPAAVPVVVASSAPTPKSTPKPVAQKPVKKPVATPTRAAYVPPPRPQAAPAPQPQPRPVAPAPAPQAQPQVVAPSLEGPGSSVPVARPRPVPTVTVTAAPPPVEVVEQPPAEPAPPPVAQNGSSDYTKDPAYRKYGPPPSTRERWRPPYPGWHPGQEPTYWPPGHNWPGGGGPPTNGPPPDFHGGPQGGFPPH